MKLKLTTLILAVFGVALFAYVAGCTDQELRDAAKRNPALAPATQAVGKAQAKADAAAPAVAATGATIEATGQAAGALGVPYSAWAVAAGWLIREAAGAYMKRRGVTDPTATAAAAQKTTPPAA